MNRLPLNSYAEQKSETGYHAIQTGNLIRCMLRGRTPTYHAAPCRRVNSNPDTYLRGCFPLLTR